MDETSSSVIYKSALLDNPRTQIRLLRSVIHAEDPDLKYDFDVHDLFNPPPYDAISYTWGDASQRSTIYVNNCPVSITANCWYALWQARQSGSVCTWVDSVCINQQNLQEKGVQVANMWTIFNSASVVLSCVGPPDEASDVVYGAMLDIADTIANASVELAGVGVNPEVIRAPFYSLAEDRFDYEAWPLEKGVDYCTVLCKAYNEFCQRPYFSRLWVAQELHAGNEGVRIMFGVHRTPYVRLKQLDNALFAAFMDGRPNSPGAFPPLFEGHTEPDHTISRLTLALDSQSNGLFAHVQWTSYLLCHDIRDHIYGTLSFVDWERAGVPKLEPDYTMTTFELAVSFGLDISMQQGGRR